jgi:hypothetical protein
LRFHCRLDVRQAAEEFVAACRPTAGVERVVVTWCALIER